MLGKGFALIDVTALAAVIAYVTNLLALIPWRRARDQHWTERARLLYPVLTAAGSNAWSIPAILTIGMFLGWPEDSPPWVLVAFAGALGVMAASMALRQEIRPRMKLPDLIRETLRGWLTQFISWFLFLGAVAMMPDQFNFSTLIVFEAFLLSSLIWHRFYVKWLSRKLSLRVPAPPRLQTIATETAARMHISFRNVWLMRLSIAQAYADIHNRDLLFT